MAGSKPALSNSKRKKDAHAASLSQVALKPKHTASSKLSRSPSLGIKSEADEASTYYMVNNKELELWQQRYRNEHSERRQQRRESGRRYSRAGFVEDLYQDTAMSMATTRDEGQEEMSRWMMLFLLLLCSPIWVMVLKLLLNCLGLAIHGLELVKKLLEMLQEWAGTAPWATVGLVCVAIAFWR